MEATFRNRKALILWIFAAAFLAGPVLLTWVVVRVRTISEEACARFDATERTRT